MIFKEIFYFIFCVITFYKMILLINNLKALNPNSNPNSLLTLQNFLLFNTFDVRYFYFKKHKMTFRSRQS